MRLTINLAGFLEEVGDITAVPYLLKMYLRDVEKLPIKIDPMNPGEVHLTSDDNDIEYRYHVTDDNFYITLELTPKD
ncbi:hypothetical protein AU156_gp065 [Edwardsiella phage PEi20]|uniref:Uncharacterized protein n=2 Tax=Kanagawavirus pei20 TaxID=2844109 RepID=A0A0B6VTT8_9CAUD|nr:hypothetical protein AU156_gp065 [Edwardsiella phage PEi20]BAQ22715.1 conserved hypothetical protein [Edwardsiella phage PEi20]BAQ23016.1 conserved hypothetical protein [Edwardsiella phage PEi26]